MLDKIRVQVIENAPLDESGLRSLIDACDDFELAQHPSCSNGCSHSCITESPHVLVIEADGDGFRSTDCIRLISTRHPVVKILVLSSSSEPAICSLAMSSGASGFVSKQVPPQVLFKAIRTLAQGKIFVEALVAKRMVEEGGNTAEVSPFSKLSSREFAIVQLMLSGQNNKSIANQLHISINTLGNHRAHIKKKLGCANMVELIRLSIRHGIVAP